MKTLSICIVLVALQPRFDIYGQILKPNADGSQKKNLKNESQFLKSGIIKYNKKDYEGALIDFEQAIKENPEDNRAYRWKGNALEDLGRFTEAIEVYSNAISLNKSDTLAYKGRAESKRRSHQFAESIEDYNIGLSWKPRDLDMLYGRGTAFFETHNWNKALADYSEFIGRYKKWPLAYFGRAATYAELKEFEKTKEDVKGYFRAGGRDNGIYYYKGLANVYLSNGNIAMLDTAIADLKRYTNSEDELQSKDPNAYEFLGMAYAKKGDSTNARLNFKKSLDIKPSDEDAIGRWGIAEVSFENYKKADDLLGKAYGMLKGNLTAEGLYQFSLAKIGLKDTIGAVKLIGEALQKDSSMRAAYELRASFLFDNGKYYRTVLSDLGHLMNLTEDADVKAEGHSLRAMVNLRVRDTVAAKNEINEAIRLTPDEPMHYMVKAFVSVSSNQTPSKVLQDIDVVISRDPTNSDAYLFKASYYALIKERKRGCETLKKALNLGGKITKETQDYICKGKIPKSGVVPSLYVPLHPRLIKTELDN